MRRVLVFVGSRSNFGRLHQLILGLKDVYDVSICLACTAVDIQLPIYIREMTKQIIRADMFNDTSDNMTTTTALVQLQVQNHLLNNYYDFSICHGDRFETLGFAIACAFAKVPLVHMEAGEYSGNIDDSIRWAITALSGLHLAPSAKSVENLGGRNNPFFTGSPAVEYALRNKSRFTKRPARRYALVLYHPTDSKELNILIDFLESIKETEIHWVNPNIDPGNKAISRKIHKFTESRGDVRFFKNLPLDDYLRELANCNFLVGNTSSGFKEAAALNKIYFLLPNRQINREMDSNVVVCKTLDDLNYAYEKLCNDEYYYEYNGLFGHKDVTIRCLDAIEDFIGG